MPNGEALPSGGATFASLELNISQPRANNFRPSALCDGGLTMRPRTALQSTSAPDGSGRMRILGAPCPLLAAGFDARAESEDEEARCPFDKAPCSMSNPTYPRDGLLGSLSPGPGDSRGHTL